MPSTTRHFPFQWSNTWTKSCQVGHSGPDLLTSAPSLTPDGFGIDWLQEVKGKQHEERHQKDGTHQGQQHVAADEQSVNDLQEKMHLMR